MMWKEVLELRQDPRIFSIIFIAPILQLTILGYAATTDVTNVPIVIVDADRSTASQALISRFHGAEHLQARGRDVASMRGRRSPSRKRHGVDGAVGAARATARAFNRAGR